ncbi:TlpA disulfide reductase family protein [Arenibacter sp. GZD96]|uniref:TlpA family protein disulfide reductase n=1 Tax=Aurantibrevibacter litoralis TaxID=3106030 RepID=UPI002AFDFA73|nr:TlpA disulfide reductase family protein [Arenibacter sp. GZD-96]MEA1786228.1 TlpA disulfide reductase family protein [Arenibacter sp. GZD-96]
MKHQIEVLKKHKDKLINALLVVAALILLFTPIGFYAKVYVNQFLSGSPDVLKEQKQLVVHNYNWQLLDTQGQTLNLEDYKGRVVVINLWATWCPPCVAEMPSFQKLYDDYADKVDFLFVANDDVSKVTAFIEKKGYTLPIYYGLSEVPDDLASRSIPTTYLIDKQGKMIIKEVGAADWNSSKIRTVLDDLLAE